MLLGKTLKFGLVVSLALMGLNAGAIMPETNSMRSQSQSIGLSSKSLKHLIDKKMGVRGRLLGSVKVSDSEPIEPPPPGKELKPIREAVLRARVMKQQFISTPDGGYEYVETQVCEKSGSAFVYDARGEKDWYTPWINAFTCPTDVNGTKGEMVVGGEIMLVNDDAGFFNSDLKVFWQSYYFVAGDEEIPAPEKRFFGNTGNQDESPSKSDAPVPFVGNFGLSGITRDLNLSHSGGFLADLVSGSDCSDNIPSPPSKEKKSLLPLFDGDGDSDDGHNPDDPPGSCAPMDTFSIVVEFVDVQKGQP